MPPRDGSGSPRVGSELATIVGRTRYPGTRKRDVALNAVLGQENVIDHGVCHAISGRGITI